MVRYLNGDDASPTEGNVEFDLLVRPLLPQGGGSAAVIVNLEPQDDCDPGYPLLARASYYCARLLSSQKGVEFLHSDYGDLKKVYSVWVLTSPPGRLRGVAQRTRVVWDCLAGDPQTDVEADLGVFEHACALVVGLTGTDPGDYTGIIGLLDALLAKDMDPRDRARIITDGYGIPGADIGREAGTMGSIGTQIALKALREGVEEGLAKGEARGIAKGEARGIAKGEARGLVKAALSLMAKLPVDCEQAMDLLGVPDCERQRYREMIEGDLQGGHEED